LYLASYWMVFIGMLSAALVLLAIFSMLAMAQRQDEDQDRLEIELCRGSNFDSHINQESNPIRTRSLLIPTLGNVMLQTRIPLNR
jgi:hypothetical protein